MDYQPLVNYSIIGDLNTVALVSIEGSIDFLCFPNFDSPSIFSALIDKNKGGSFSISPKKSGTTFKQMYLPDTNILFTRFLGKESVGEIIDHMPVEEINEGKKLIRRVTGVRGNMTFVMKCNPRFNYGQDKHSIEKTDNGVKFICKSDKEKPFEIELISETEIKIKDSDAYAEFTLKSGESVNFIFQLSVKDEVINDIENYVNTSLIKDIRYWRKWIKKSRYSGRWRETVHRSALLLKLLTSKRHGSMVASPTFGLPEDIGGERNWDYRYTWIRDSAFSMYVLLKLGYKNEASNFINWIEEKCMDITNPGKLHIMYTPEGGKNIKEITLDHFEGYKKSNPVRVGNIAIKQLQLDIYGELLNCVYLYDKYGDPISYNFWNKLTHHLDWLAKNWMEKDESIWEVRAGKQEFLFSRIMSWVAFDRGLKLANNHSLPVKTDWYKQRDKIFNDIHENFWDEDSKSFVQYKGGKAVDASVLLMPIVKFISPKDPQWVSTLRRIEKELVSDSLVSRYSQSDAAPDGMEGTEGTFTVCTFWYVECLALAGETQKARFIFEKMLGYANHVHLFSEQIGTQGEHLGNFPQAFSHLGLISAAFRLDDLINKSQDEDQDFSNLKSFLS